MGIQGLMKLITEEAPLALREKEMENLNDRKVAIDASMAIYQFLVAVRSSGPGGASTQLTNEAGDVTSHIQGMFNRTIKMMESGVKPVYVFDGKPPQMKGGELAKRIAKRAKAETDLSAATEAGDVDEIDKFSRRLVKATRQHSEECKELLALMGVPFVNAPCEAEAQCAELAEQGKVFATATEDMDALTFRTPKLLRRFTSSQGKEKQPIIEVDFALMLEGFGLTYPQFVDLCILCGCDYCSSIKGIGPKTALRLIKTHGTLENIVAFLKKDKKYEIPPDWQTIKVSKKALLLAEAEAEAARLEAVARADALNESKSSSSSSATPVTDGEKMVTEDGALANGDEVKVATEDLLAKEMEESVEDNVEKEGEVKKVESIEKVEKEGQVEVKEENGEKGEDKKEEKEKEKAEDKIQEVATKSPSKSPLKIISSEKVPEAGKDVLMLVMADDEGAEEDYEIIEPLYLQARLLFLQADVTPASSVDLKWEEPKEEELRKFLVERMGFNSDRVSTGIAKLQTAHRKKSQKRMDSFFTSSGMTASSTSIKRKAEDISGKGANKKGAKGGSAKGAAVKKAGSKPGPKKR